MINTIKRKLRRALIPTEEFGEAILVGGPYDRDRFDIKLPAQPELRLVEERVEKWDLGEDGEIKAPFPIEHVYLKRVSHNGRVYYDYEGET